MTQKKIVPDLQQQNGGEGGAAASIPARSDQAGASLRPPPQKTRRQAVARTGGKAVAAQASARWQGRVDGVLNGYLYGWAFDCEQPDARVVLEICLNGQVLKTACADAARLDLPELGQSDCCHGFVVDLQLPVDHEPGVISVRIANLGVILPGQPHVAAAQSGTLPHSALNYVFSDGALRLFGWAMDSREQGRTLSVQAWLGDDLLATAKACLDHPSLRMQRIGQHAFSLELPLSLADGRVHHVRVVDEDGRNLSGSPLKVCHYVAGAAELVQAAAGQAAEGVNAAGLPVMLQQLLRSYERLLPRGLGMRHYAQWRQMFGQVQAPASSARFALLLHGAQDGALPDLTRLGAACTLIDGRGDFAAALQQLRAAQFDFIALCRSGDSLCEQALALAAQGFADAAVEVVYSDSELALADAPLRPWFKPAWNPEYALGSDYPLELMVLRGSLLHRLDAGRGRSKLTDCAQLAWQALAMVWQQERAIVHIPHVLYRFHSPLSAQEREQRLQAAQDCLRKVDKSAGLQRLDLEQADFSARRLQRKIPVAARKIGVSLIIPTRDCADMLLRCIASIRQYTVGTDLEIIVVDNDSCEEYTHQCFARLQQEGVKIVPVPGVFNFSRLNNRAVQAARGEIIGMINNDIEALHEGWLEQMLSHLLQPGVGAVGAKLLWPNRMVQHGGVILGVGEVAGHFGNLLAADDAGDHGRNLLTQQVSAVTAACLLLRRADYLAVGGMDEQAFPVAFNDVDLCLKLRARGQTVVWCAEACLLHAESASRGDDDTLQKRARARREIENLRARWGHVLLHDPAYHPSLNLDAFGQAFTGLAMPPRARSARYAALPNAE